MHNYPAARTAGETATASDYYFILILEVHELSVIKLLSNRKVEILIDQSWELQQTSDIPSDGCFWIRL